jgi:hypothetical protein
MLTKDVEYVVALYEEDPSWLLPISSNCHIYHKGCSYIDPEVYGSYTKLKNVGRESHSYLYHIVSNYDILANTTLFTQGKITDHVQANPLDFIQVLMSDAKLYGHSQNAFDHNVDMMSALPSFKLAHVYKELKDSGTNFGGWMGATMRACSRRYNKQKRVKWYMNGIFALDKKTILSHPKTFYIGLLAQLDEHVNPEVGHYFERAWYEIFVGSYNSRFL